MKALLLVILATSCYAQEISYNFGGNFAKGKDTLVIDVQDGAYWIKLTGKTCPGGSCVISAKAAVKNGALRIQTKQGAQSVNVVISAADHTNQMQVRGLKKADQDRLLHWCCDSSSVVGAYTRI